MPKQTFRPDALRDERLGDEVGRAEQRTGEPVLPFLASKTIRARVVGARGVNRNAQFAARLLYRGEGEASMSIGALE